VFAFIIRTSTCRGLDCVALGSVFLLSEPHRALDFVVVRMTKKRRANNFVVEAPWRFYRRRYSSLFRPSLAVLSAFNGVYGTNRLIVFSIRLFRPQRETRDTFMFRREHVPAKSNRRKKETVPRGGQISERSPTVWTQSGRNVE